MNKLWKFPINFDAYPDYTEEEIRALVIEKTKEANGDVFFVGDEVYMLKFEDAFSFRLNAGTLVGGAQKLKVL